MRHQPEKLMRALTILLALAFFTPPLAAYAYTKQQLRANHAACQRLVKMDRRAQMEVARKGGVSLPASLAACRLILKNGVERTWALEQEYRRGSQTPRYTPSKPERYKLRACSGRSGCGAFESCVRGYCSVNGCRNSQECSTFETCRNGTCQ
ncbi:MAG: hypothetical protein EOP11_26605 [Proteobacteria bacterium]|nr:MAG: hypothetical protein EOP11_26605 [Pseudomonadota bacterium]